MKDSTNIENNFIKLQQSIIDDIVRRIRKTGKITSTADWQIQRLKILGNSSEEIEKLIKETLNATYPEMYELYDRVIEEEYVRSKEVYEQVNAKFVPYEDNKELQQLVTALSQQSYDEIGNITQSMGFYLKNAQGKYVYNDISKVYTTILDDAVTQITSGAFDYNTALRKAVYDLTKSGLRTVNYASGHKDRVEVAARRAVMTGITQLSGQISESNAEKLGTDLYEVSWHAGARPSHAEWHGRIYSMQQLQEVCGYGQGGGLQGWNCRHIFYPFIDGISERMYSDEWLDEMNKKENTPKGYKGKEYTAYEATQEQRRMERNMRVQRERIHAFKTGSSTDLKDAKIKYRNQMAEYKAFSKAMKLVEQKERIYIVKAEAL